MARTETISRKSSAKLAGPYQPASGLEIEVKKAHTVVD